MPRLLIVAPDSDLRRSLEFALRAEGYDVSSASDVNSATLAGRRYDCTVIDHHALGSDIDAGAAFCQAFAPAILLANTMAHPLSPWTFRTVLKPFLGPALSEAVRDALRVEASPTYSP